MRLEVKVVEKYITTNYFSYFVNIIFWISYQHFFTTLPHISPLD